MNAKIENALRLLGLIDVDVDENVIKKAYRKAAAKYHPDRGGSLEMMKAVNDAYDALKGFAGRSESEANESNDTYPDELNDALNVVISLDDVFVEVCGLWIWVTGDTRTHKDALKAAGYKWAKKKVAWYFRPADYKSSGRSGGWDLERIRETHGSRSYKASQQEKIKAA